MICIEYYHKAECLDAIDEYIPEVEAVLKFDTEKCTLSNLMQGMIDIARFAGYYISEDALAFVFDDLRENL